MIRLILTGGLGNQMFEYAAAKSLALKLNKKLVIDLYALDKKTEGTKRHFELDVFDININISSSWRTRFFVKAFPLIEKNRKIFKKVFGYFRDRSAIVFTSEFNNLKGNIILHGHFQNEEYFNDYKKEIRQDFNFTESLAGKNQILAKKMKNSESIAMHIRRGDYLTDNHAKNNFAICTKEYYQEAITRIQQKIDSPHFFIFSESFDWVKKNIQFSNSTVEFIDWNTDCYSYIDMQLMSLCKHNIIANSSFSWWAAWLNTNEDKMVYAPSQWFREEIRNKDLINFYPTNWTII